MKENQYQQSEMTEMMKYGINNISRPQKIWHQWQWRKQHRKSSINISDRPGGGKRRNLP